VTDPETESPEAVSPDASARVGARVASYVLEELLGEGAMGAVYRARHVHMKNAVALKLLHPEVAEFGTVAARFEREAVAAARVEHPNIAQALDFGKLGDGSYYLVLEYVRGSSLTDVIASGALDPVVALGIARQIAEGVGAAHDAGIIHRDLKPDNVVLDERDGEAPVVKVLDFGIAKLVDEAAGGEGEALTKMGSILGTPEYMAPEQAGGGELDGRADLYALGIVLYEMLAGRLPFRSDNQVGLITQHIVEPPPPLPDGVPPSVAALVLWLLAKEPAGRPATAAAVVQQIDVVLAELASADTALDDTIVGTTLAKPARPAAKRPPVWAVALGIAALSAIAVLAAVMARPRPEVKVLRHSAFAVHVPKMRPAPPVAPAPTVAEATTAAPTPKATSPAKRTTTTTKRSTSKKAPAKPKKRNTVAGIYIPPPSQWF
jgi:serine/threonine protein kinase